MLDRVLAYVRAVIAGERKGDPAVGRYLLDTFATSTEGLDQGSFASSLQVRAIICLPVEAKVSRSKAISYMCSMGLTNNLYSELGYTHDFVPR